MDKICEFCTALRPVVYCKADAAHLCLSCDARVHSANGLSGRHLRTLLCQSCRNRPAYVRCMNHEMFICRNCERTLHGFSSQHEKRLLKTYMGCPSPKDFAVLWGFEVNLLDNFAGGDRFVSSSTGSEDKGVLDLSSSLSNTQRRMNQRRAPQQDNEDILQQIIGLKRLQHNEQTHNLSRLRGKEQARFSSTVTENTRRLEENIDSGSMQFPDISNDLQAIDISHQVGLKDEQCSSPFSQLEHLASTTTVGTLTNEDTSWQWKCPVLESQLWTQNLQDLGFCEKFECFNDIPDVDPTFRNFEDLFGDNNQEPLIGNAETLSASFNDNQEDEGVSTIITMRGETSSCSEIPDSDGTKTCTPRFKDMKKSRMREKEKQARYSPRAADLKKRGKDHFAKPDTHQSGSISSSESY